jgi:hypothetical protein
LLDGPNNVQRATAERLYAVTSAQGASPAGKPLLHLRHLETRIEPLAVPTLVGMLASVTHLHLTTGDALTVIPAVATLSNLQLLKLMLGEEARVSRRILLTLRNLAQLRVLHLWAGQMRGVSDDLFVRVLSPMSRQLRDLSLIFYTPPSRALLGIIGETCQQLRRLEVWGVHFLDAAVNASLICPLFPMLEYLTVGGLDLLPRSGRRYVGASCVLGHMSLLYNPCTVPAQSAYAIPVTSRARVCVHSQLQQRCDSQGVPLTCPRSRGDIEREAKLQARLLRLHAPKLNEFEEHGEGSGFGYDMWEALEEEECPYSDSSEGPEIPAQSSHG